MSRKKKHEEHENHERWLVSYADFITLLFAFFTVLYATAQTDQAKLEAVVNGMNAAFEGGLPLAVFDRLSAKGSDMGLIETHTSTEVTPVSLVESIKRGLQGSLSDNVVQVGFVDQTLTVSIPHRIAFATGSAELHPSAFDVLAKVARSVAGTQTVIEVTGFADGTPVRPGGKYADNWDLAGARSIAAVRFLERHGVASERMTAAASVVNGTEADDRAVKIRIRADIPRLGGEITERLEKGGLLESPDE